MNNHSNIKPLSFWMALLYFGIPALFAILIVHLLMPFLDAHGVHTFFNYLLVYATAPMLALLVAALVAYRLEGNVMSWPRLKTRFRLTRMDGRSWLWAIGLILFMVLSASLLSFTSRWLASFSFLAPPASWPAELNPTTASAPGMNAIPTELMGIPLKGNWWILVALLASLVIATLGEEFWWRGYILPRQELVYGNQTWIIHGCLWTLFHLFAPWNLITLLPGSLALSYVAQRLRNTWPAVIAHGLANGLGILIVVVIGIIG